VLYMRYGIPILTLDTLTDLILEDLPPLIFSAPGGYYVNLDGEMLRSLREKRGLSLGSMAEIARVSKRAIRMYEEGMNASVETACLLEEFFDEPLVKPMEVLLKDFETDIMSSWLEDLPSLEKEIFNYLASAGYDVFPIHHFPFNALSQQSDSKRNVIMTGVEMDERLLKKKARMVSNLSEVTGKRSVFIVKRTVTRECVEGMPLLKRKELKHMSDAEELLELIIERSQESE